MDGLILEGKDDGKSNKVRNSPGNVLTRGLTIARDMLDSDRSSRSGCREHQQTADNVL